MSKKAGIGLTVFAAMILLCCLGLLFTIRSATAKITEVIERDQKFVATLLNATAKTWDENEFSKVADDSFNTPAQREQTKKLFATLKSNLGGLVSLGEVKPGAKTFRGNSDGTQAGLLVSITADAKFEKGDGVFTVVVKNVKEKMSVVSISLDPQKPFGSPNSGANKPSN